MYVDLMGKGIRVICNPEETGRPSPQAPHDIEGTILYIRVRSNKTAIKVHEGRILEILSRTNNSADIAVRWDNDIRTTLWPGAFIVRSGGSISSCSSIWAQDKACFDDRPFTALQPQTHRPRLLMPGLKMHWTGNAHTTAQVARKVEHYTKFANTDAVPSGWPNAVVEDPGGRIYSVNKPIHGDVQVDPLQTEPGAEVVITEYTEPIEPAPKPSASYKDFFGISKRKSAGGKKKSAFAQAYGGKVDVTDYVATYSQLEERVLGSMNKANKGTLSVVSAGEGTTTTTTYVDIEAPMEWTSVSATIPQAPPAGEIQVDVDTDDELF